MRISITTAWGNMKAGFVNEKIISQLHWTDSSVKYTALNLYMMYATDSMLTCSWLDLNNFGLTKAVDT